MKRPSFKRLILLVLVIVPLIAWFLVKPVRVVAPGLVGITCPLDNICVDDPARLQEASALHVLQGEQIGVIRLMFKPSWFVEGMAYALSEDPRETLMEPFETDRKQFRKWYPSVGKESVWAAASDL